MELLPSTRQGQASWSLYTLRPASQSEIKDWFEFDQEVNIGILTGPASIGGLYVFDIDNPMNLQKNDLPPTVIVETKRGWHFYFHSEHDIQTKKIGDCGSLQGAGSYVVAAWSAHPAGSIYGYADTLSPGEIAIAELPDWFLENVGETKFRPRSMSTAGDRKEGPWHTENTFSMPRGFESLKELNAVPEVAIEIMGLCGRKVKGIGKSFKCPLPGHTDKKPSASLWQQPGKAIVLHDFHMVDKERLFWPLVDVYASCMIGKAVELRAGERVQWWLRALHQAGYCNPPIIKRYELPPEAPGEARTIYRGFTYLVELQQLYKANMKAPFNRSFAAKWCKTDVDTVRRGMRWLLRHGYLFVAERGRPNTHPDGAALTMFEIGRPRSL